MEKEMVQNLEWIESQKIPISIDLFAAAKQHLNFLETVDKNRWLSDGPILERAIYRYNAYWLPLLAKYSETSTICEGPLVPPLDCEWIWHCHKLNPVRYISDCKQLYGKVLDNYGIVSSTNGCFQSETENLWKRLYPMESYNINLDKAICNPIDISSLEKCTTYDLISAVKRQSSFYSRVLRAHVDNEIIMQEAVGRYKAFLYLFKRNREMSMDVIGVPTHDIDLMWHTHLLYPSSYYNDLKKIFGNIVQHEDDTKIVESKQSKKLDNIFSETTTQWEETFGQNYLKANGCLVTVVEKKNDGCVVAAAEKKSVGYDATAVEKKSAQCQCMCLMTVAEKKSVGYNVTAVEKKSAQCQCMCLMTVAEKKSVGCVVAAAKKKSVGCVVVPIA
ncbi:unnamed protein product [Cochlearia groenlandica]